MLATLDAPELTHWMAYERIRGPIDGSWKDEMLASIHEQLQSGNYLAGGQSGKKNPVPKPQNVPRPWEREKMLKRAQQGSTSGDGAKFDSIIEGLGKG
jgi:hypothetical protein